MSEHTPGPWRANASLIEGPKMALRVADIKWPGSSPDSAPGNIDEARANARLIAAAPELLEALQYLSSVYENIWVKMSDGEMAIVKGAWDLAEMAIAKAEGAP